MQRKIQEAKQHAIIALFFAAFWGYGTFINPLALKPHTLMMLGYAAIRM